jgi:hypothetical protein
MVRVTSPFAMLRPVSGCVSASCWRNTCAGLTLPFVLGALGGCAPGPDVVFPPGPAGAYPELLPIDTLLAQADAPSP